MIRIQHFSGPLLPALFLAALTLFWSFAPLEYATLQGTYLDKHGNPIPGAHVVYERDGELIAEDYTDLSGYFALQVIINDIEEPNTPLMPEPQEMLEQNKPNPFFNQTKFEVNLEEEGEVSIYDLSGRLINRMELSEPGTYELQWRGGAPGTYICAVSSDGNVKSKKMIQTSSGMPSLEVLSYSNIKPNINNYKSGTETIIDSLEFSKENTTYITMPFELLGDSTITQVGNPGPNEFNPIPNANANVGDTLSWYILNHVYNDEETNDYTPLTPNTWVSNDTLYFLAASQGTHNVQLNVTDLSDPALEAIVDFYVYANSSNIAPVAVDDNAATNEDVAAIIAVLANDYDPDGNLVPSSVSTNGVQQPANGSVSVNPTNGNITYTPFANWFGTDSFEYVVWDDGTPSLSDTAMVTVQVASVNDAPTAVPDNASTPYQTATDINVPANDYDIDGNVVPSSVSNQGLQAPANGSILINPTTGVITYTPNNGFSGTDTFQYKISDNGTPVLWDTTLVTVNVGSPNNQPPVAVDDVTNTNEDNNVTIDVLANDYDPDGNLVPSSVSTTGLLQPLNGSTVINSTTGAITYSPFANWYGTDQFEYKVGDDGNPQLFDIALVTVNVASVNDAPVANDDTAVTNEDVSVVIPVLNNDSDPYDPEGALVPSSVTITTQPLHGSVSINYTNGNITYTPANNYFGADNFVYQVGDNGTPQLFDNATVSLTINSVNDAPVAVDDNANTDEDNAVTIDVLVNDYDIDGSLVPSTVSVTTQPLHGSTSINTTTGAITYTPAANWYGSDSFVYQVGDDGTPQLFDNATVSISVASVNDPPVANDDASVTNENTPVTIDVLANDSDPLDPEGGLIPSSVTVTTQPSHGSTSVNPTTGAITYTPTNGYSGADSFVYQVGDNGTPQLFDNANVSVTVNNVGQVYFKVMDLMTDTLLPGATLQIGSNSYVLSQGDTTMTVSPGTFQVDATHPGTIDWTSIWQEYTAIQRPGQNANVEQRARDDASSPVTFTSNDDTLYIYKVMNDFNMYTVSSIIGSGPQGQTVRFGADDLNAPAWMNLNYITPTAYTRDWLQYWLLDQLPPATNGKLNMVWEEDNTTPTVPYLEMRIQTGVPAQNGTPFDANYEITFCYAYWPNNSQSPYSLGIEALQAVGNLNDIGGSDPPILSLESGNWVINHTGQECFHLLYNFNPGTKF